MMPPALTLDLLAAVLGAGASPPVALLELAGALEAAGDPVAGASLRATAEHLLHANPTSVGLIGAVSIGADPSARRGSLDAAARSLSLAQRSGLPPAELLRSAARRERTRESASTRAAIRRLEVLLVLPAGLCLLPAFVLLGVAPVVISLLRG